MGLQTKRKSSFPTLTSSRETWARPPIGRVRSAAERPLVGRGPGVDPADVGERHPGGAAPGRRAASPPRSRDTPGGRCPTARRGGQDALALVEVGVGVGSKSNGRRRTCRRAPYSRPRDTTRPAEPRSFPSVTASASRSPASSASRPRRGACAGQRVGGVVQRAHGHRPGVRGLLHRARHARLSAADAAGRVRGDPRLQPDRRRHQRRDPQAGHPAVGAPPGLVRAVAEHDGRPSDACRAARRALAPGRCGRGRCRASASSTRSRGQPGGGDQTAPVPVTGHWAQMPASSVPFTPAGRPSGCRSSGSRWAACRAAPSPRSRRAHPSRSRSAAARTCARCRRRREADRRRDVRRQRLVEREGGVSAKEHEGMTRPHRDVQPFPR